MVGNTPGFFTGGELRQIWRGGYLKNHRCGCGVPFRECPFWTEVGDTAFGGWDRLDIHEILALRESLDRAPAIPQLLRADPPAGPRDRIARYTEVLDRLYRAIGVVAGCGYIVDSSKSPAHALLLRKLPHADVRVVHLVRDSRGSVFSLQRRGGPRHGREGREGGSPRLGLTAASTRWLLNNELTHSLRLAGLPYMAVRYEDVILRPGDAMRRILDHAGVPPDTYDLGALTSSPIPLRTNHLVFGNRIRVGLGELRLRLDEEWKSGMPPSSRLLVTAMTLPGLLQHGYPLRTGHPATRGS
jgi:hypothetical protein